MARLMKDSGIEWIGEIPEEWETAKVSRFYDIQLGKMLQPEKKSENETFEYYLCAANVGKNILKLDSMKQMWFTPEERMTLSVKKGDMLVVEGGDIASCDIVTQEIEDVYFQNALHRVRPLYADDIRILKYLLWVAKFRGHIDLICNKATIAHFSKDKFAALHIPTIPVNEQHRIADFLDRKCAEIDSVEAETRRTIEEYKALRQSIITEAVTRGVRGDRPMKDSGIEWIGEIPEEWDCTELKRFCKFQTGGTPSTANQEWFDGDIDWFTPGDFSDNYLLSNSSRKLSEKAITDNAATMIPESTVLIIGIGGTAGKIGITTKECSCNQQITALLQDEHMSSRYLMYWMIANTKFLRETALFTTLPIINNQTIGEYTLVLPNKVEEQKEIVDFLDAKCAEIDRLISAKQQLLTELESYKKSVIYEYVTGKKEVPCL